MEIIGKPPINSFLFYSGKIAGYITWIVYILLNSRIYLFEGTIWLYRAYGSYILACIGLFFIVFSLKKLGNSTRLGLPTARTILKTSGIYKISRNPMYLGFNILTIASVLYSNNVFVYISGIYSIIIYHFIIKSEERYLESNFGENYKIYKNKTRRYL